MWKWTADRLVTNAYRGFVVAGACLPLLKRSKRSGDQLYCVAETLGLELLTVKVLKTVIPAPRPDNGKPNSFPSSHTALAFSTAAVAASIDRPRANLWYAGAALIGASRILLNRHRPVDVAAGAILGAAIANRVLATELGGCDAAEPDSGKHTTGPGARRTPPKKPPR